MYVSFDTGSEIQSSWLRASLERCRSHSLCELYTVVTVKVGDESSSKKFGPTGSIFSFL